ncbi:MAG: hypothetical protein HKL82_09190 [Acidimicrobiaceae bacterium]|nr:hypothetical protein [Acidimicrobiaceae bacterium]
MTIARDVIQVIDLTEGVDSTVDNGVEVIDLVVDLLSKMDDFYTAHQQAIETQVNQLVD